MPMALATALVYLIYEFEYNGDIWVTDCQVSTIY